MTIILISCFCHCPTVTEPENVEALLDEQVVRQHHVCSIIENTAGIEQGAASHISSTHYKTKTHHADDLISAC